MVLASTSRQKNAVYESSTKFQRSRDKRLFTAKKYSRENPYLWLNPWLGYALDSAEPPHWTCWSTSCQFIYKKKKNYIKIK